MLDFFIEVTNSLKIIFKEKKYIYIFLIATVFAISFYIAIPVYTIPGNDLEFWLKIMPWWGHLLLILFSTSLGILITMKIYEFKHGPSIVEKTKSIGSITAIIIAGVYTTAACGACISALFAFIGAGGILFLDKYREIVITLSFALTAISIYLTAKKINNKCDICK